ncbi:hypothetical protein RFI_15795 [Reticulomyxa filosa]|uniref:Uncharacterized protein n=1 Tax=Reticulomyxa filosa TaxID=46433 RepID=X6N574_RETFI|nr:hypothetical protein RFI_15795 [Reticulomyxa filosa]|eukprot:ETO21410.1 hypothetical protein RFI_15795 [Reticulomyxa filosa]
MKSMASPIDMHNLVMISQKISSLQKKDNFKWNNSKDLDDSKDENGDIGDIPEGAKFLWESLPAVEGVWTSSGSIQSTNGYNPQWDTDSILVDRTLSQDPTHIDIKTSLLQHICSMIPTFHPIDASETIESFVRQLQIQYDAQLKEAQVQQTQSLQSIHDMYRDKQNSYFSNRS